MYSVSPQEAISHCKVTSAVAVCGARGPVAGNPLRQEANENHFGS